MARRSARDFDPRILEIFDGYVHGETSKRAFTTRAGRYAAGGVTGAMLPDQLGSDHALAQQAAPDDPEIETEVIEHESPVGHGAVHGLMAARPAGAEEASPAVLACPL